MWGTGVNATDPSALAAHHSVWFKEYGAGCLAYSAAAVATFVGSGLALKAMEVDKPVRAFTMLALLLTMLAAGGVATVRHSRRLSVGELESLLPLLKLSDTVRAYAETIVALHRSKRPQAEIEEGMATLNALLDEEARLVETRARLAGSDGRNEREALASERERIAQKVAATRDAGARVALEQSLSLVEERQALFEAQGSHLERIDAHLELLRQAVLSTRDAARRLGGAPVATAPDLATDTLRSAVANARAQTQATERALAELRAI